MRISHIYIKYSYRSMKILAMLFNPLSISPLPTKQPVCLACVHNREENYSAHGRLNDRKCFKKSYSAYTLFFVHTTE
jgi:hypothetical protein